MTDALEVPRIRTTPTTLEWRDGITAAWDMLFDSAPTVAALSVLWAQWALETARGRACYAWNLGNIKAVPGDGRPYCVLHTFEFIDGKRVEMDDHFRAFPTLLQGALDYLRFLSRPSYAEPWACVLRGDADAFARALKAKGYYTAPVEDYARNLRALAHEFTRISDAAPPTDIPIVCSTCHDPATPLGAETFAERRAELGFGALATNPETPVAKSSESERLRALGEDAPDSEGGEG